MSKSTEMLSEVKTNILYASMSIDNEKNEQHLPNYTASSSNSIEESMITSTKSTNQNHIKTNQTHQKVVTKTPNK